MSEGKITLRWREPVRPLMVVDTTDWATARTGRATLDFDAVFRPSDIERFRLGYCCIECWEPHESPLPAACSLCGYPMREQQQQAFQRLFKGVKRNPRAERIETELDALDDKHERNFHTTKLGIIVPGKDKSWQSQT